MVRARRFRDGGFTLVELLVVIGILSIMVLITVTQLVGAREKAMVATCDAHLATPVAQLVNDMDNVKAGNISTMLDPNAFALTQFAASPAAVARNPRNRGQIAYFVVPGGTSCPITTDPSFSSCVVGLVGGPSAIDEILLCQRPTPTMPVRTYRVIVN